MITKLKITDIHYFFILNLLIFINFIIGEVIFNKEVINKTKEKSKINDKQLLTLI